MGNTHYCEHSFTTGGDGPDDVWPGAFAEYMKTTETALFHKPAARVVRRRGARPSRFPGPGKASIHYSQMQVGDDVVVIGVGGIGLFCLMVARAAGAGRLIAVDPSDVRPRATPERGRDARRGPDGGGRQEAGLRDPAATAPTWSSRRPDPIAAVKLMVDLRRRGTRWNVFGITTHETFELDGGLTHFLEGRMDASFGTTPLAMQKAIRLMESGLVDPEKIISHRFALERHSPGGRGRWDNRIATR